MRTCIVILAALAAVAGQELDQNQLLQIPADQFLQQLRNWQIALSAPGGQDQSAAPRYGNLPPPTGPISLPQPPEYQGGGGYPGQGGGYYPTPPTKPTQPPHPITIATPKPPTNPLSKYCKKPRGQFPSKTCNKYVNCWDDVVVEQECPKGLVFSEKGYCDYPENVDCSRRPIPPKSEQPPQTMPVGTKICPTLYGYYRDTKNCSIFYMCVGGHPVKFECPPTLVFNTENNVCDYYYNVPGCPRPHIPLGPGPVIPPVTVHYPTQSPPHVYPPYNPYQLRTDPQNLADEEEICTEGALHRLNEDCSQVSLCREGKTEVINCGSDRAYDSVEDRCVAKHLARC